MTTFEKQPPADEIDIILLFKKFLDLIRRRYLLFLAFVFAGIVEGSLYYLLAKPQYKSTLIASSEMLRNEYVTMLFNNLNELINENNPEQIASFLKINTDVAKTISSIKASKVELKELKLEGTNPQALTNTFQIDILVTDTKNLKIIQNGIIHYIKNNAFVKKKVELQQKMYQSMIAELDKEIRKLDTTRLEITKSFKKQQENKFLVVSPSELNNSILLMNEKKINYQNALILLNEVLVIQDFIEYKKPASPKLITSISISTGTMVTIALLFIGLLEFIRIAKKY